jgi:hypothetical protein
MDKNLVRKEREWNLTSASIGRPHNMIRDRLLGTQRIRVDGFAFLCGFI